MTVDLALHAEALSVSRAGRAVLNGVSISLARGEIVAVLGPNGAGKSTLLEALVERSPRESVWWLADECLPAAELTVAEHLECGRSLAGASRALSAELSRRLALDELSEARCETLSRGEARRVLLHGALCSARPALILDEPLGTFDPLQLREVVALLRERAKSGIGVLLSVHQLSDAQKVADRFVVLSAGSVLASGSLAELRAQVGSESADLETIVISLLERAHGH